MYLGCFILFSVVKYEEWNPEPLNVLESESILRTALLQVEVLDPIVIPATKMLKKGKS